MNKQHIANAKHCYIIDIDENDALTIKVVVEHETLEFDGIKGNLMDASDFESHFDEEETEMTYEEMLHYSVEFLTDWGVDTETAEAIRDDLKEWFKRYAMEEPKADAWEKVLIARLEDRKKKEESFRNEIPKKVKEFRAWAATADETDIYYGIDDKAKQIAKVREAYKEAWAEYKNAEAELNNYRETMHIR